MSVTCVVTIHGSTDHDRADRRGRPQFRAYAEGCGQSSRWRDTIAEAEADAQRMDAHACPFQEKEGWERLIPFDQMRTKRDALLTEATMRYMPWRQ